VSAPAFGEAQLAGVAKFFLLDTRAAGGLALSDDQYGWLYGMVGVAALLAGGLLGGWVISRRGLKCWLWPMLLATLPSFLLATRIPLNADFGRRNP
jgi:PAT family beta-lactamase induction signal transducer AmpG